MCPTSLRRADRPEFQADRVLEETAWKPHEPQNAEKIVRLRVERHETRLRTAVKSVGGRWNPQERVWELRQALAEDLGLEDRIVENRVGQPDGGAASPLYM